MRLGQAAHYIWACAAALRHRVAARPARRCMQVNGEALGGFKGVLASLFSEPRDEYVHFF